MRYEKADVLLQLALEFQASRCGLSLADIEQKFAVSRRTAMRMRDAAQRAFPQLQQVESGDRTKRWRLPPGTADRLLSLTAEELAALEGAVRVLERDNRAEEARALAGLAVKVKALLKPDLARRIAPDLEALLESEGLAMRPGPRPRIDGQVVETLRQAIKAGCKIAICYRSRRERRSSDRVLGPYGFIHGHRNYLVARGDKAGGAPALFALPNILKAEIVPEPFVRDPDFSLHTFANRSFGLFQAEPFRTVWRFSPAVAEDAREFIFHPSQNLQPQPDGSLLVTLIAASEVEMAWHLTQWGDQVEVLEPPSLAALVNPRRMAWGARP